MIDHTKKSVLADIVKRKLWKFGYSVKDLSDVDNIGFDLIVDGQWEVIVKPGRLPEKMPKGKRVVALVDAMQGVEFYWGVDKMSTSPYDAFGKPEK